MKRSILASLALAFLVVAGAVGSASAHVLKSDGDIGVVLHINPDDAPTTGSSTSYTLYFSDTTGKFALPKCDCSVAIKQNDTTIYAHAPIITSSLESDDTYTFAKSGVYTLQVSGQPKEADAFQPFAVDYLVRVEAQGGAIGAQPFPPLIWVGMALAIGLILLAAYKSEHGAK